MYNPLSDRDGTLERPDNVDPEFVTGSQVMLEQWRERVRDVTDQPPQELAVWWFPSETGWRFVVCAKSFSKRHNRYMPTCITIN